MGVKILKTREVNGKVNGLVVDTINKTRAVINGFNKEKYLAFVDFLCAEEIKDFFLLSETEFPSLDEVKEYHESSVNEFLIMFNENLK